VGTHYVRIDSSSIGSLEIHDMQDSTARVSDRFEPALANSIPNSSRRDTVHVAELRDDDEFHSDFAGSLLTERSINPSVGSSLQASNQGLTTRLRPDHSF
jgi:hypothetical protein